MFKAKGLLLTRQGTYLSQRDTIIRECLHIKPSSMPFKTMINIERKFHWLVKKCPSSLKSPV